MKYSITESTNIDSIPKDTAEIHLVRPIKWEKLKECGYKIKIFRSESVA